MVNLLTCIDAERGALVFDENEICNIRLNRSPSYEPDEDATARVPPEFSKDSSARRRSSAALLGAVAKYAAKIKDAPVYKTCKVSREHPFHIVRRLHEDDELEPLSAVDVVGILRSVHANEYMKIGMTEEDLASVLEQMPSRIQVVPPSVVRAPLVTGDHAPIRDPVAVALERLHRANDKALREQLTPAVRRVLQDAVNWWVLLAACCVAMLLSTSCHAHILPATTMQ